MKRNKAVHSGGIHRHSDVRYETHRPKPPVDTPDERAAKDAAIEAYKAKRGTDGQGKA